MKFLRVQISDDQHARLKLLCTHHGELSYLVRRAIREYLDNLDKEANNAKTRQNREERGSTPESN